MSWAPGKFIKNSEFKKHWNEELGSTFIPWDRLGDTTLESLREGGVIDPDSVPPGMEVPEGKTTLLIKCY